MIAAYRDGATIAAAGAIHVVKPTAARRMLMDAGETMRTTSRKSCYAQLNDAVWLASELQDGRSIRAIALEVGCQRSAVYAAVRRHAISGKAAEQRSD
jgi:hypothetical protein